MTLSGSTLLPCGEIRTPRTGSSALGTPSSVGCNTTIGDHKPQFAKAGPLPLPLPPRASCDVWLSGGLPNVQPKHLRQTATLGSVVLTAHKATYQVADGEVPVVPRKGTQPNDAGQSLLSSNPRNPPMSPCASAMIITPSVLMEHQLGGWKRSWGPPATSLAGGQSRWSRTNLNTPILAASIITARLIARALIDTSTGLPRLSPLP
ncbi:hypothetical protein B0T22DRAFT_30071 [Podospora appendiculata]|uniref:Uncharacterized protein n=1 Tax=Podospora appendiculata TaxID=314037 RepID=A0AAE0XH11_9PEZI|nr:hypothetical protein B0T22DRAFT_30071 [Podospora appendiculata]